MAVLGLVLSIGLLLAGCGDNSLNPVDGFGEDEPVVLRQVTYALSPVTSEGALPDGLTANALLQELDSTRTLVTIATEDTVDTHLIHPVHIHANEASEGGPIATFLGPIDNAAREAGRSRHVIEEPLDSLLAFDGHINIHESNATLDTLLAQGDMGANSNASPTLFQLDRVADPRTASYPIAPVNGGFEGEAQLEELTPSETLLTVRLADGSPETDGMHPVHLRTNDAATGGTIAFYLGAIDGRSGSPGTSTALLKRSFDDMLAFDGHIRIHESNETLDTVLGQGNIGANATP